jgi:putative ABC transport system ATP-binding protein
MNYSLFSKWIKAILIKNVAKLSGGEKQRLALIRTLIFQPEVMLLDEITSALDADNTLIVE